MQNYGHYLWQEKSQTACHKFQQQILGISWKDKVWNEDNSANDIEKS